MRDWRTFLILGGVVIVFGLAIALAGSTWVRGALAGLLGVLLLTRFMSARAENPDDTDIKDRNRGDAFAWEFSYPGSVAVDLRALGAELASEYRLRMRAQVSEGDELVLEGGNQLRARLIGGWFTDRVNLPVRVTLEARTRELRLSVCDTMGPAIRDDALKARYRELAADIQRTLENSLPAAA